MRERARACVYASACMCVFIRKRTPWRPYVYDDVTYVYDDVT